MKTRRHRAIAKAKRYTINSVTIQEPKQPSEVVVPLQTNTERHQRAAKAIEGFRKAILSIGRRVGKKQ